MNFIPQKITALLVCLFSSQLIVAQGNTALSATTGLATSLLVYILKMPDTPTNVRQQLIHDRKRAEAFLSANQARLNAGEPVFRPSGLIFVGAQARDAAFYTQSLNRRELEAHRNHEQQLLHAHQTIRDFNRLYYRSDEQIMVDQENSRRWASCLGGLTIGALTWMATFNMN